MNLGASERLILANQYRILELLNPENAKSYRRNRIALEDGYEAAYDDFLLGDGLTRDECFLVNNILHLYRVLQASLPVQAPPPEGQAFLFPGFDQDGEVLFLCYARFLRSERQMFNDVAVTTNDLVAATAQINRYRSMLEEWQRMGKPTAPDASQTRQLLAVPVRPPAA